MINNLHSPARNVGFKGQMMFVKKYGTEKKIVGDQITTAPFTDRMMLNELENAVEYKRLAPEKYRLGIDGAEKSILTGVYSDVRYYDIAPINNQRGDLMGVEFMHRTAGVGVLHRISEIDSDPKIFERAKKLYGKLKKLPESSD